jgi:hypothetical protein
MGLIGADEPLPFLAENPFVVRIEIHSHHIEETGAPTEFIGLLQSIHIQAQLASRDSRAPTPLLR